MEKSDLRNLYQEVYGKNPYMGWNEDQLVEKLKEKGLTDQEIQDRAAASEQPEKKEEEKRPHKDPSKVKLGDGERLEKQYSVDMVHWQDTPRDGTVWRRHRVIDNTTGRSSAWSEVSEVETGQE